MALQSETRRVTAAGLDECSLRGGENKFEISEAAESLQAIVDDEVDDERDLQPERTYKSGPQYISWGDFKMGPKGLFLDKDAVENTKGKDNWICGPLEVLGACRDPHGNGWGKYLRWRDADGRIHTRHVADAALQGDPATLCAQLAREGLNINRSNQRRLAAYLKARVTLVHQTG